MVETCLASNSRLADSKKKSSTPFQESNEVADNVFCSLGYKKRAQNRLAMCARFPEAIGVTKSLSFVVFAFLTVLRLPLCTCIGLRALLSLGMLVGATLKNARAMAAGRGIPCPLPL